jgi:glutamate/tyrosine decarboxylase-like PLP-dependent enzyme
LHEFPAGTVLPEDVPSPLFVNIENSRRFRALPVYASLLSLGKEGYQGLLPLQRHRAPVLMDPADIVTRNIRFAQDIAHHIHTSDAYELLNPCPKIGGRDGFLVPSNIVLFRASSGTRFPPSDPTSAVRLTRAINATQKMYVSSTQWRGQGAVRVAVSNWRTGRAVDAQENRTADIDIVKEVLDAVVA